jgi:hypothetical protein
MSASKEKEPAPFGYQVFGLHLIVRMLKDPPQGREINCPKGGTVLYGVVEARGDGYDADAREFRDMPDAGVVVTFEETGEDVEGHYFYVGGNEYRIVHLDSIIVAFPSQGKPPQ